MSLYDELQTFLQRATDSERQNLIRTAKAVIGAGTGTNQIYSSAISERKDEEKQLVKWARQENHWIEPPDWDLYVAEGAEHKVFFMPHTQTVIKLNTGIFYEYWRDYLLSLLLHNFFFPATGYELLGFTQVENQLCAVVEQPFVQSNQLTDLNQVKAFLQENGFTNTRNNDYYHPELKIILEDLHDENVLTYNGVLFFIDTVFYMKK